MHASSRDTADAVQQHPELPAGIRQVRLPLPFKLDHINVYLLEDTNGHVLIDTGFASRASEDAWHVLLGELEADGKPIQRIFLTHMHPDHLGMASWLHNKTGAPIHLSQGEWIVAKALWDPSEADTDAWKRYLGAMGLPVPLHAKLAENPDIYRKLVPHMPDYVEPLADGMGFKIGNRLWRAIVGRGHSPEHVCFWCEEERIFINGDLVLPDITPNIGVMHIGPSNPLQDYLSSLEVFEALDPLWTLPSHGKIGFGPSSRIAELRKHHIDQLSRLRAYCARSRTAYQCTEFMFGKQTQLQQFLFAVREALAHLNYLTKNGELKSWDSNGNHLYQVCTTAFDREDGVV